MPTTAQQNPIAQFNSEVAKHLPQNRSPSYAERQAAVARVAQTKPDLHVAYLKACNPTQRASRLINEKYS